MKWIKNHINDVIVNVDHIIKLEVERMPDGIKIIKKYGIVAHLIEGDQEFIESFDEKPDAIEALHNLYTQLEESQC